MEFPAVEKAHIVSVSYLRNFAREDGIGVCLVDDGRHFTNSPKNVGWRKRYYSRTRPDGTRIDDVEWSMSHLEGAVAPLLREIEQRWPLDNSAKATLAEFTALQLLRGPRFRHWGEQQLEQAIEDMGADEGLKSLSSEYGLPVRSHDVERVANQLRSATHRHVRMLALISKIASILGSMHWTLLRFDRPLLATSDHPVHVWPMERRSSRPLPGRIGSGILKTVEIRLPLSPQLSLLMTWLPEPDAEKPVLGARHHPRNINAFTIAEAQQQWFYVPGTRPPVGAGTFLPISSDLYVGYDAATAWRSPLRERVDRAIQPKIGADLADSSEVEMVRVREAATAVSAGRRRAPEKRRA